MKFPQINTNLKNVFFFCTVNIDYISLNTLKYCNFDRKSPDWSLPILSMSKRHPMAGNWYYTLTPDMYFFLFVEFCVKKKKKSFFVISYATKLNATKLPH